MASKNDHFDDFFDEPGPTAKGSNQPDQRRTTVVMPSEGGPATDDSSSDYSSDGSGRSPRRSNRSSGSRSPSRSRDSSFSDSRSQSPGREGRRPSASRSPLSGSGSSGSGSSRGSDHERRNAEPGTPPAARTHAWSQETRSRKSGPVQEKRTSHGSSDRKSRQRRSRDKKRSPNPSDSDITDVSAMSSPRSPHEEQRNKNGAKPPKCAMRAPGVKTDSKKRNGGGRNALELNLLTKAVSELEKQTRVKANTRRVVFDPAWARREPKSNYTFSDSDTHRIDQENQRLLRKIMCQMHAGDGRYIGSTSRGKKSAVAPSGINRLRDHQRIEKENLAFLRRLQHIQPSRGLSRHEQLSAYNATLLHGVPITSMHDLAPVGSHHHHHPNSNNSSSSKSRTGSEAGSLGRTRSLTSVQSAATTTTSSLRSGQGRRVMRSRPSSAKTSLRERPPWDDRW